LCCFIDNSISLSVDFSFDFNSDNSKLQDLFVSSNLSLSICKLSICNFSSFISDKIDVTSYLILSTFKVSISLFLYKSSLCKVIISDSKD